MTWKLYQSSFFGVFGVFAAILHRKNTMFGKVTGNTIFNILKFNDLEIGEEDRPFVPPTITSIEILLNPFDDIIPRRISKKTQQDLKNEKMKKKKAKRKKLQAKKVGQLVISTQFNWWATVNSWSTTFHVFQNKGLLSFGDDVEEEDGEKEEEEEDDTQEQKRKMKYKVC